MYICNGTKICNDLKRYPGRHVFSFDGGTKANGNIECIQLPNILLKFFFVAFKEDNIYKEIRGKEIIFNPTHPLNTIV